MKVWRRPPGPNGGVLLPFLVGIGGLGLASCHGGGPVLPDADGLANKTTIEVPGDFTTLAEAFAAADAGDTVLIHGGTYSETRLEPSPGIRIRGVRTNGQLPRLEGDDHYETLRIGGNGAVEQLVHVDSLVIANSWQGIHAFEVNLRLSGCRFESNRQGLEYSSHSYGIGVELDGCEFVGNGYLDPQGGNLFGAAMLIETEGFLTLRNCSISQNIGGEDVYSAVRVDCPSAPVTFRDCDFDNNKFENRGALSIVGCQRLLIEGCRFVGNESSYGGPALDIEGRFSCVNMEVSDCSFVGNLSQGPGAIEVGWLCFVTIIDSRFMGNRGGTGGAIRLDLEARADLRRCFLKGNQCVKPAHPEDSLGGGLQVGSGAKLNLRTCTLLENGASAGSAIGGSSGAVVSVVGSILAFGRGGAAVECGDYTSIGSTDIFGNAGGDWVGSIADQLGGSNLNVAPGFCNPEEGDYSISWSSPLAVAGAWGAFGAGCD